MKRWSQLSRRWRFKIVTLPALFVVDPVGAAELDTNFNTRAGNLVFALAVQPDGKILVGGEFTTLGGQSRTGLGRLNPDGSLDTSFAPSLAGDSPGVSAIALQADGKIVVGGVFTNLAGQVRNNIGRLNSNGTLDTTFNPNADWVVSALAVQADGKIVIGGGFTAVGGQPRANIARLNAAGTLDTAFNPGIGGDLDAGVYCLALQADGKILVGGIFTTLGGQPRSNLGRLTSTGSADSFDPEPDDYVESLAVQTDGKILVGGPFKVLAGASRTHLGRLAADGTSDSSFSVAISGANFPTVTTLALQADGKVFLGGNFTNVAGVARTNLARLINPDAATQSLAYAGTTVTW